ncbi:MAG: hypothetical protein ACE5JG_11740, partial [Planctomycetota bacterium]
GADPETVERVQQDYRRADLTPRERALCDYAIRLTEAPGRITKGDLGPLRETGLGEAEIHDAVQVIAYFNYINRIADGLGTDLEPEMPPRPEGWGGTPDLPRT